MCSQGIWLLYSKNICLHYVEQKVPVTDYNTKVFLWQNFVQRNVEFLCGLQSVEENRLLGYITRNTREGTHISDELADCQSNNVAL